MIYYVTRIHMAPSGERHEHIEELELSSPPTSPPAPCARKTVVDMIKYQRADVRVRVNGKDVEVRVVEANPPYVRTYADGDYTNNLLNLPRY